MLQPGGCLQAPVSEVAQKLRELGIEGGWGSTVGRIRSTMLMLGDIIQAPDPETLQASLRLLSASWPPPPAVPASITHHELYRVIQRCWGHSQSGTAQFQWYGRLLYMRQNLPSM